MAVIKHPRTLIREAVAARLSANLPEVDPRITPARISIHRATPLFAGKLPAILIYTREEQVENQVDTETGVRQRKLELSIEVVASGETAAMEADAIAQAIESIIDADETLGKMVEQMRLTRTEIDQDGDGDTPILAVRLSFAVRYWTKHAVTDGVLPVQVLAGWSPDIGIPFVHQYQFVDARSIVQEAA